MLHDDVSLFQVIAICCTNTFSKYLDPNSEGEAGPGLVGTKVSSYIETANTGQSCVVRDYIFDSKKCFYSFCNVDVEM